MSRRLIFLVGFGCVASVSQAARLSMNLGDGGGALPPSKFELEIMWTMGVYDAAMNDIDGFVFRFNVWYPSYEDGVLIVDSVNVLPGWNNSGTMGIGQPFTESNFALTADDASGVGIPGNGSGFTTVIASVILRAEGDVTGTQVTFRHNNPSDPLPSAFDGPQDWSLRWQEEVTGSFQFDIGAGNPGDGPPAWPYHGYESSAPIIIPPEPSSLALLALATLAFLRSRRARPDR